MHELIHEFTHRKISPWGGLKYFHKTYTTSGIRQHLSTLPLPSPGSNRGYNSIDLVEGFLASVIVGARRLEHSGMLRTDAVIKEIFGWQKGMASASTFSRFFAKFDSDLNRKIFPPLMRYIINRVKCSHLTIDIDSTVITRHGHQEKAAVGYNPRNKGKRSHYPIMAFCDELKMVVTARMRSGNSDDKTGATDFLNELFTIVEPSKIGLIRGDVGFYSDKIFSLLEQQSQPVNYIFRGRISTAFTDQLIDISEWYFNEDVRRGASYTDFIYKGQKWKQPRRIIIVRTPREKNEKLNEGELFAEYEELNKYEYSAFITNTNLSAIEIHRRYNQRGDSENRIKELKYDYALDGFALQSFAAMEAAFLFIMVAFNIMTIFKQAIMLSPKNHRLSTIRFQCIAIGSYLIKSGRKSKMKLSAEGKRRHFLEHLFKNLELIRPPYKFSNA